MLWQARTDLDAFNAHDLDKPLGQRRPAARRRRPAQGSQAVKYIEAHNPGIGEVTELMEAVTALIAGGHPKRGSRLK